MRRKNRNPIEARGKLPQFTTMHVIEGQAGQINYTSLIFYSLTFNNILNIIVMLILVAVTITMAVNGGLFGKAADAGRQTNEAIALEQELGSGIIRVGNKTYESIDAYLRNDPIDQGIIVDETLEGKQFTLEIEADYNAQTGTPITKKLNPTLIGIEGTPTWTSNNKSVADVDNTGLVTAIGAGTAEITASVTYRDVTYSDECTVKVEKKVSLIAKNQPYVGCYVDMDNQPGLDGIIYADLAVGRTKEGNWGNNNDGAYTIPVETDLTALKDYYIIQTDVVGPFGTTPRNVIKVLDGCEAKKERFYVMSLSDFTVENNSYFYWDKNYNLINYGTFDTFGSGSSNTNKLIKYWDNISNNDIEWTDQDIWGSLTGLNGWFVPSKEEWSAFAQELGITLRGGGNDFDKLGLSSRYWTSSQYGTGGAWCATWSEGGYMMKVPDIRPMGTNRIRLSSLF